MSNADNMVPRLGIYDADRKVKKIGYNDPVYFGRIGNVAIEFMKLYLAASITADAVSDEKPKEVDLKKIVAKSIEITELAYSALEQKGWVMDFPLDFEDENQTGFVK